MSTTPSQLLTGWSVQRKNDGSFLLQGPIGGCVARRQGSSGAHEDVLFDLLEALTAPHADAQVGLRVEPPLSTLQYLERARYGWQDEAQSLQRRLRSAESDIDLLRKHASNDVWHWQGDGYDRVESMANEMVVVIHAADLRELVAGRGEQANRIVKDTPNDASQTGERTA